MIKAVKCFGFMGKPGRSTKAQKEFRVGTVYKLLGQGYSRGQIIEYVSENFGLGERSADNFIADARDKLLSDADMARPAWLAEALARLRTYEQAAAKRGQLQVALNSVQAQARLIGMDTA